MEEVEQEEAEVEWRWSGGKVERVMGGRIE